MKETVTLADDVIVETLFLRAAHNQHCSYYIGGKLDFFSSWCSDVFGSWFAETSTLIYILTLSSARVFYDACDVVSDTGRSAYRQETSSRHDSFSRVSVTGGIRNRKSPVPS
jgi:hypothetical protein